MRLLHAGGESDRVFDLQGSMQALGILPCVRQLTTGTTGVAAAAGAGLPRAGEYPVEAVEQAPRLTNAQHVSEVLASSDPPALRAAGGRVMLRVRPDGSVDEESITVVSTTHAELVYPPRRVAAEMRFTAGRVNGQPVTTIVNLPIQFQPAD